MSPAWKHRASLTLFILVVLRQNIIKNSGANILDLVLVTTPINCVSPIIHVLTCWPFPSDFVVSFCFPLRQRALWSYECFPYSSGSYFNMYQYFQSHDWKQILSKKRVDSAAEVLDEVVSRRDNFVPKRVSRINKYPSWLSKKFRRCLWRKLHYHRILKKNAWVRQVVRQI